MLQKAFDKLKFSPVLFKKYHHLFVWCLKMKINEFQKCKFCFPEKQTDLKRNCTRLWRFVLMITYSMLTQKILFPLMTYKYFQNKVQLLGNELKKYVTT